jgi:hypothetical protein
VNGENRFPDDGVTGFGVLRRGRSLKAGQSCSVSEFLLLSVCDCDSVSVLQSICLSDFAVFRCDSSLEVEAIGDKLLVCERRVLCDDI